MKRFRWNGLLQAFLLCLICGTAWAQGEPVSEPVNEQQSEPESETPDAPPAPFVPSGVQTLGGLNLWQDVFFFQEWRIQYNILLKYHRLLDPQSGQLAFGTLQQCRDALERLKVERSIPPMRGRVLVLLHGFASNRLTMQNMACWFRRRGNYTAVVNITYPSMWLRVDEEVKTIASIVQQLEGAERIDFIGHSLGALVLRSFLSKTEDPRIGRLVQLCPPNQGADVARMAGQAQLSQNLSSGLVELMRDGDEMLRYFGIPKCPFGIIAGGTGDDKGYSSFLPGDDDGAVSVAATLLDGSADFLLIPDKDHAEIPNCVEAFEASEQFLNTGKFAK